jgi:hypothetical protein
MVSGLLIFFSKEFFFLGNGMPNIFLSAKAIARMIANDDPYKEGEENNTITFLKMFLPERFLNSTSTENNH